jgi:ABC-type lipoprotein release transport system permease subunit
MPISLLIAWRYLWSNSGERALSAMTLICFLSIALASGSLALVISIMTGFERETQRSLQSIHAPIIMQSSQNTLDAPKIMAVLQKEFPEVKAASPSLIKQVMLQKEFHSELANVIYLKGVIPEQEAQVSSLATKIIAPSGKTLSDLLSDNQILIGSMMAEQLNLHVGDQVTVLFPTQLHNSKVNIESADAIIGGIFKTGIAEFDEGLIYANLTWISTIFSDDINHISLSLHEPHKSEQLIPQLKNRFHLDVYSWQSLYPSLVSALTLEKYAMSFILLLIALVAAMNLISLLYMQIIKRRADIAMLKAMGISNATIRLIFLCVGLVISSSASIVGLMIAALIGFVLQNYLIIPLPDTYYVTHLPVVLDPILFILLFGAVLMISIFATIIPLRTIGSINIAQVLRFEG